MWDLMRGKGVASTKIGKGARLPCSSRGGWLTSFVGRRRNRPVVDGRIEICRSIWLDYGHLRHCMHIFFAQFNFYSHTCMQSMTLLHTITHPSRLHDVKFSPRASGEGGELLLAGAEDKKLAIYEVSSPPRLIAELVGHERRCGMRMPHVLRLRLSQSKSAANDNHPTTATITITITVNSNSNSNTGNGNRNSNIASINFDVDHHRLHSFFGWQDPGVRFGFGSERG